MTFARAAALLPVSLGAFVTYPVLRFLLLPLLPALGPDAAPPAGVGPSLALAAANSIRLGALSAGFALAPALWLGWMLERRAWGGRRALAGALWLLFLLPGYLAAAGWQILLGAQALHAAPGLHGVLRGAMLGWPGLVGLTALKGLPVATLVARAGWAGRQPRLEDAMRVHVRGRARRAALSARPMLPFAATAFLVVFVEATQDYGLAATLGTRLHAPLLVTEVYASLANWPISWPRAARAADLLVLLALLPVALRLLAPAAALAGPDRAPPPAAWAARALGWAAAGLLLGLGAGVPLLALAAGAASPEGAALPDGAARALLAAVLYAFAGSVAALGLACALAAEPTGPRLLRALAWLPMLNMAVPGIVLGAAGVIAFNGPPLPLMGTPLALLLAEVATQLPVLTLFLRGPIRARGGIYGDAARVHGIGLAGRIERIYWPPLLRPLAWAWSLAFCRLFFELPLAQMLAPAGGEPVAVVLVQLQQSLRFAAEARLAALAVVLCGGTVGAVLLLAERRR